MRLPIYIPKLQGQKYSCHGCGSCCRDFTVQLTDTDLQKLHEQGWKERLGQEYVVQFRGHSWLKQTDDGACVFLGDNGLCKVHAEFGLEAKPLACQFFPFMLSPNVRDTHVGISFACGSVVASKGADLESHRGDVRRMSELLPASAPMPVQLQGKLIASESEVATIETALDGWLRKKNISPAVRYQGLAWLITSLLQANLGNVRGEKLRQLASTLSDAVEQELPLLDWPEPSPRAWKLLRQAVFTRIEDPKIGDLLKRGKVASVLGQWARSRKWAVGKGISPKTAGFRSVDFASFESTFGVFDTSTTSIGDSTSLSIEAAKNTLTDSQSHDAEAMDDLLQRWIRATILGGRAWGSGLYGLPIDQGLGLIMVNLLTALWLARFHAAGRGAQHVSLLDLQVAVGRVDRTSGRAVWLATAGERLRVKWLSHSDSLRLLARALV
ncbi:MAG: YkgJ family cysteine cluster protein [Phycisphaerales bacterium]